jgi:hypothetical protein
MGIISTEHPVVRDGTAARDATAAWGVTAAREGMGTRVGAVLHRRGVLGGRGDRQGLREAAVRPEMRRASPRAGTAEAETTEEGEGGKTGKMVEKS